MELDDFDILHYICGIPSFPNSSNCGWYPYSSSNYDATSAGYGDCIPRAINPYSGGGEMFSPLSYATAELATPPESAYSWSSNESSWADVPLEPQYENIVIDNIQPEIAPVPSLVTSAESSPSFLMETTGALETPRTKDIAATGIEPIWNFGQFSRKGSVGIDCKKKTLSYPDLLAEARKPPAPESQKKYSCKQPGCDTAFSRQADLARHVLHVHKFLDSKQKFFCDYENCNRSESPHHRKDHFRDHLRDVHREDLIKHGSNAHGPAAASTAALSAPASLNAKQRLERLWLCSLSTDLTWWRCSKCLKRVRVEEKGYTCCKTPIEPIRLEARKYREEMLQNPAL